MKNIPQISFVTFLKPTVFLFSALNFLRLYEALHNWEILQHLGANPLYLAGSGLGWGTLLLLLLLSAAKSKLFFSLAGASISLVYFIFYWVDRLFWQTSPANNLSFSVVTSIAYFLFIAAGFLLAAQEDPQ